MAKKTTAKKKPAAKKAPAKKKPAAKKAPAKKKPAAKKAPAKKKPAAKKAPAKKKPAAKKAPAKKKPAAKKAPAKKKPAAKKAPAKKKPAAKKAENKTTSKPTGKKKTVTKASTKSGASAKATPAKKPAFKPKAKRVAGQGVLIQLKATASEVGAASAKRKVPVKEMSKGETPIELHHRKPTKKEFVELRESLVKRQRQLAGDVNDLEEEAFNSDNKQVSSNHLADSSFDQYEQEFNLSMIENESEELREIARAIEKLDGGNYGTCENCGIDISIERLRVMTYTRICIDCRSNFEETGGGEDFGVFPERRV